MNTDHSIQLEFNSDPDILPGIRGMVVSLCERFGFKEHEIGQIALAVDEALANVIRHGYESSVDGQIWMRCRIIDSQNPTLQIVIEDEGNQVDSAQIQGRDLDDVKPGGLGVHIMREVMDKCEFEIRDHKGMKLTLEKTASPMDGRRTNSLESEVGQE